jgi:uncharacterized membrane protein YeaQ/YmgE (transglycosylase-associated protein family)
MLAVVDLSPAAQFWVNLVLVWIGFGTLAGLLARGLLPTREPAGAAATVVAGIVGSAIGLTLLRMALPGRQFNPISPLGLAAAAAGAFLVLAGHRIAAQWTAPKKHPSAPDRTGELP